MKVKLVISTLAMSAACALGAALPASSVAATDVQQASSENWSGYVVGSSSTDSSQKFKSVSGSWVAPTAKCNGSDTYSAFWVGLGGSGQSNALEQDGTEADCAADGTASYFAWYELVPAAPVKVDLSVHPGDKMTGGVTVEGNSVTVSLKNDTTGRSYTKTLTMSNPDTSSAEWIAEAPSQCQQSTSDCTPLALTDFGSVNFSSATATTTSGHTGSISDPDWATAAVTLSPSATTMGFDGPQFTDASSSGGATPSGLSADGSAFSVAYAASGAGEPASSGSGGGYGSGGYGAGGYPYGDGGYGYGYGGYPYGDGSGGYGYDGSGGYGDGGYGYGYGDGGGGYYGGGYAFAPQAS